MPETTRGAKPVSRHRRSMPGVLLLLLALASVPARAQLYQIIDIGTLGGDSTGVSGLNAAGWIVGWSETTTGNRHAFLYANGEMSDLGTLTGGTESIATDINDRGQVAGVSGINAWGPQFREFRQGFLWEAGDMHSLGALWCPCTYNTRYGTSEGRAVNVHGESAGWSETVRGQHIHHAFLWTGDRMHDIGGEPGESSVSRAHDINDAGQIIGDMAVHDGADGHAAPRAALWEDGAIRDLGTLGADASSTARAINENGRVVGWSETGAGGRSRAFVWENDGMRELGQLPGDSNSRALGQNDFGQMVGWSAGEQGPSRAVLWQEGLVLDLNTVVIGRGDWQLLEARDVNNSGLIAGIGYHDNSLRGFLLEPVIPYPRLEDVLYRLQEILARVRGNALAPDG